MPKLTFVEQDGSRHEIEATTGQSILDIARDHDVSIEGACEGSLACSTCHIMVDPGDSGKLPAPDDDEKDMLGLAYGATPHSRLACQVQLTGDLEKLTVTVPPDFDG